MSGARATKAVFRGGVGFRLASTIAERVVDRKIVGRRDEGQQLMRESLGGRGDAMVNGKTPFYLTVVAAILFGAAVLLLQPYSADFPGTAYAKPARTYLRAAIRQDSLELVRRSASAAAVAWALHVARAHPDSLTAWAGHTYTYIAGRRADTAEVLVYPAQEPCSEVPIVLHFIGTGRQARVLQASSACLNHDT